MYSLVLLIIVWLRAQYIALPYASGPLSFYGPEERGEIDNLLSLVISIDYHSEKLWSSWKSWYFFDEVLACNDGSSLQCNITSKQDRRKDLMDHINQIQDDCKEVARITRFID